MSNACVNISDIITHNGISNKKLDEKLESINSDGDNQKRLDVIANEIILDNLQKTSIYAYLSEENENPIFINNNGKSILSCDPLDGSSNIDNNATIGTIFSIFDKKDSLLQKGKYQKVAGFFSYGPQTTLLISFGYGTIGFCKDKYNVFHKLDWNIIIPNSTNEYSINSSNEKYWPENVKNYVKELCLGKHGLRKKDYNMRWTGSLVADAWRIFKRGGVFLYTEDNRNGYENGRLRLLYEAFPISFLVDQCGGKAINGDINILDLKPDSIHQRVPLIFGSSEEVDHYKLKK